MEKATKKKRGNTLINVLLVIATILAIATALTPLIAGAAASSSLIMTSFAIFTVALSVELYLKEKIK